MNSLIVACLKADDNRPLSQFPRELMSDYDKEIVAWILNYKNKYKEPPSEERLLQQFPNFVAFKTSLPLWDQYDVTVERKKISSLKAQMVECLDILENGKVPTSEIRESAKLLSVTSGMEKLTSFDRTRYFRSKTIQTGLTNIDRLTKGVGAGEVLVISGRLGTGKSTIAQYIAYKLFKEGKKVMFVSNEMLASDVFSRVDGFLTSVNPQIFRSSKKGDTVAEEAIHDAEKELIGNAGEIFTPSAANITPSSVFSLAQDFSVDAMIIDSFYLMQPDSAKQRTAVNWERVLLLSNEIKRLARETGLPVITVTQMKRDSVGSKAGAIFGAEDLSFSDGIGQDADFILAIKPDETEPTLIELQLIKNRFGSTGNQQIIVDFDTMTIKDFTTPKVVTITTGGKTAWEA